MTLHHRLAMGMAAALFCCPAQAQGPAPAPGEVLTTYADIAEAMYGDALTAANTLEGAVTGLLHEPSDDTLKAARDAWVAARVPYQQTEGFRFGNAQVEEWQGRVNRWRMDEGLIDYVDGDKPVTASDNPLGGANVIAAKAVRAGENEIDVSTLSKEVLVRLHGAHGNARNVATGYHAIEFLLWGQDLNGTAPGAGIRPATDFSLDACTGGNCERRRDYLKLATELLTDDLKEMGSAWGEGGAARKALESKSDEEGLAVILAGMAGLSQELAHERMMRGLSEHDPRQEHDRFSDNTHNAYYYNQIGMASIYNGTYKRISGTVMRGPNLADYVRVKAPEEANKLEQSLTATTKALGAIKKRTDDGTEAYDQMLADGNNEGNALMQTAADALMAQARAAEGLADKLGLKLEGKKPGGPGSAVPAP
ncbi:peptidase [Agaricicola taiwanensis]|uniref:Peptidase n=1 Tax=Agaricicola taiwanensis TaxID=591372 RepID=A0A8J2YLN3_9RHOB|nr:imelysin family protein [Agaricicola taiwanensis]GGE51332.1 peptidase [Agaricicola taiwanensis]